MSVIFGTCLSRGSIIDERSLLRLGEATARYGADGTSTYLHGQIGMGFQPFHTTNRSRLEQQPTLDHLGNILVLDGRLDNYHELAVAEGVRDGEISDSSLILKSFDR